jgi:hypothetical protein
MKDEKERNKDLQQKDELLGLAPAAKADFEELCKAHDEWEDGKDRCIAELEAELASAWSQIESAYDIEPRSYFEEKYRNSGATPLQMAIHYIWKRDPKAAAAHQQAAREAMDAAEKHASAMRDRADLANEYGQGRADLDAKADAAMEIAAKILEHFGLEGK